MTKGRSRTVVVTRLAACLAAVVGGMVPGCAPGEADVFPAIEKHQSALASDNETKGKGGTDERLGASPLMAAQIPLVDAATAIRELRRGSDSGYAGIALDVERRMVQVWWKGEPPSSVQDEIRRHTGPDVQIEVRRAANSEDELMAVAQQLVTAEGRDRPIIHSVGPKVDGSALSVAVASEADLRILSRSKFPVPLRAVVRPAAVPLSRGNDFPPYWSGAILHPEKWGGTCSTGFAVANGDRDWKIEWSRGVLTAEHCAPYGNVHFYDGGYDYVGPSGGRGSIVSATITDSLFIKTSSAPRIYAGVPGPSMFSLPVDSQVGNFPGQFVCTSGGATGAHCDIQTTSTGNIELTWGGYVREVVWGTQLQGQTAAGSGDSGGVAFTLTANFTKVRAAGQIILGQGSAQCPVPGQTGCFNEVAFVDMAAVLSAQQVYLLTE